jgi:hypothetical protein
MRTFLRDHWKSIVAIIVLVVLAMFTVNPGAAAPAPSLAERLRTHMAAIASSEHNTANPRQLEQAARYIESTLEGEGYAIHRQEYEAGGRKVRNIEVSIANVAPHAKPERIFIVGAHYDSAPGAQGANDNGSGSAAVLELARLLKTVRPSQGTEIRFVFFVNEEPPGLEGRYPGTGRPDAGNFIAFVGPLESSRLVQQALSAFQGASSFPAHGLAAPDYVQGVTLSDHASYNRFGYPAIMITDTAFMRYPYYHTADDTPDKVDYASVARVVSGLARTIEALAAAQQS